YPAAGRVEQRCVRPGRIAVGNLLKSRRCRGESPRQIMRLRRYKIDAVQQTRVRMQQARIVQDRERFIKMPVVYFKFRKLQKSRGSGRRIASCASQIGKQSPGSLSAACP